jgi:hypothetical protein
MAKATKTTRAAKVTKARTAVKAASARKAASQVKAGKGRTMRTAKPVAVKVRKAKPAAMTAALKTNGQMPADQTLTAPASTL